MFTERACSSMLVCLVLASVAPASAAPPAPADRFTAEVSKLASQEKRFVQRWFDAPLGENGAIHYVAELCPIDGMSDSGLLLVVWDSAQRAHRLQVDIDGRNARCKEAPASPPKLEHRSQRSVTVDTSYHHGTSYEELATRAGELVVVRSMEAAWGSGEFGERTDEDWDTLVRTSTENYSFKPKSPPLERVERTAIWPLLPTCPDRGPGVYCASPTKGGVRLLVRDREIRSVSLSNTVEAQVLDKHHAFMPYPATGAQNEQALDELGIRILLFDAGDDSNDSVVATLRTVGGRYPKPSGKRSSARSVAELLGRN